jgi:C-terminal processing protease CtpA/Prc
MKRLFMLFFLCLMVAMISCAGSGKSQKEGEKKEPPSPTEPSVSETPYKGGLTKEQRIADAQAVIGLLERMYAPRAWKEKSLGVSFEESSKAFLGEVSGNIDDVAFYDSVARYLAGFKDAHMHHFLPSTALVGLPFDCDYIDGHVIVTAVSESIADKVHVGDDWVELDGKPIADALEGLAPYIGIANKASQMRVAAYFLTNRLQATFPYLPEGTASIKLKSTKGEERELSMDWVHRGGDGFAELNDPGIKLAQKIGSSGREAMELPILKQLQQRKLPSSYLARYESGQGSSATFVTGDKFVERKTAPFLTGVFVDGDKKIGYLRIHSYSEEDVNFNDVYAELEEEIPYFEENTDALIIDQNANPGGDLCFLLTLSSFFFDKPFKHIQDIYRANRSILMDLEAAANNSELPFEDQNIAAVTVEKIKAALKRGDLLTEPITTCSLNGEVPPYVGKDGNIINYSKPVLVLADELSASGGDYFAAVMQDSGRAKIFGATTMGAGGNVIYHNTRMGYSEINMSHTVSLGLRAAPIQSPDVGESPYIENTGVIPDIPYKKTLDDFMSGYAIYRDAAIKAAIDLFAGPAIPEPPVVEPQPEPEPAESEDGADVEGGAQ